MYIAKDKSSRKIFLMYLISWPDLIKCIFYCRGLQPVGRGPLVRGLQPRKWPASVSMRTSSLAQAAGEHVCAHPPFVWAAGAHTHHSRKWSCVWLPAACAEPSLLTPPHWSAKPHTLGNSVLLYKIFHNSFMPYWFFCQCGFPHVWLLLLLWKLPFKLLGHSEKR